MKAKRKLFWFAVVPVMALVAGLGLWARPVDCFNGINYLREWLSGAQSRSVQVAGHRVHYVVEGPAGGPVVALVHGLSGRAEDWRGLAPYLVKAGCRVYLPDLPGHGRSEKPAGFSYSVHDQAEVVVGFLDALGLRRVDLGGWSMGGGIAQHVAARHPARVRRLMLFDAAGIREMPKWDLRLFTPTSPEQLDQLDALLMPRPPKVPGFVARDVLRVMGNNAWVAHRALDSMLTGQDATDRLLPQLRMPVLIVWGAEDRIIPLSQGETMHRLVPQSELAVFPGCGHLAPLDCAKQVGPKVVEFLQR
jgi:pimeloyl-ACP methyl ester carboxylesterase